LRKGKCMTGTKATLGLLFIGALFLAGCTGGSFTSSTQSSAITSVSVSCSPASVQPGKTSQCSVTVAGTGSYSPTVSWSAVSGTITSAGLYTAPATAPASGSDTIKATSTQDSTKSGTATIAVSTAVASPTVTAVTAIATPASISLSQTATCVATVTGTGAYSTAVTWTATGGTITQGGVFTPSGTGTGTCTANSAQAGYTNVSGSANIAITATPPSVTVTGVSVVATPASITTAQTATCVATVTGTGAYSTAVTWTATGGTITSGGVFTPSGTGTGTCTAHSAQAGYTNVSGSANIAVTATSPSVTVTGVSVAATPASITLAQTTTCVATVTGTGAYSTAVTWTATGGTITQGGVFTPTGSGTGTCIANSAQAGYTNVSGSANITVTSAPFTITTIAVAAAPASITTAQTSTCSATVSGTGTYSSAVTWTATGGTITAGGVFTPSGAGTATCTAHSAVAGYTNISGSSNIVVASATPTITAVSLVCTPSSITPTQTSTCTPTVTGTGAFTNTVNLTVSPSGDGTLSASTGVASGTGVTFTPAGTPPETVTITATSTEDSTKSAPATVAVATSSGTSACAGMSLGNMGSLNGFVPFPSTAAWNTDISAAPLDPNSTAIIAGSDFSANLHPDFSNVVDGDYGIPYVVVDSSTQPLVSVDVGAYADESDVAYEPIPSTAPIEGFPANCSSNGDQHVLVLDRNSCMLYETYNTVLCNGAWSSDSETIWDLQNYEQRPWGWTSADAAGLPVFPGLVRYDEVAAGAINHALRFTLQDTRSDSNGGYFVEPASHAAGNSSSTMNIMGMRIRLKASVDISSYSAANQVILNAMKKYGMILADNGSNLFFQGTPDARWDDNDLDNLKNIPGSDFEVVQMTPAYPGWDDNTAPTGAAPTINSFTASASTVTSGSPVTLTWTTTNDSYDFIDKLGGVRGGTITIMPTATTTYTLNATNQYGRSTKAVTVTVQ
jgi:hypothetical protein